jgi:hypothetical protein
MKPLSHFRDLQPLPSGGFNLLLIGRHEQVYFSDESAFEMKSIHGAQSVVFKAPYRLSDFLTNAEVSEKTLMPLIPHGPSGFPG